MRRWAPIILLAAAGCSNAPLAGFLDLVNPSHVGRRAGDAEQPPVDPLGPGATPAPSGGQLLPPASPPAGPAPADSGFAPPPLPHDPPLSPAARPGREVRPLTLPNG